GGVPPSDASVTVMDSAVSTDGGAPAGGGAPGSDASVTAADAAGAMGGGPLRGGAGGPECQTPAAAVFGARGRWCGPGGCDVPPFTEPPCPAGEFCETDYSCGATVSQGRCLSATCTSDFDDPDGTPVCGCDGVAYRNACDAHAAGVEVADRAAYP